LRQKNQFVFERASVYGQVLSVHDDVMRCMRVTSVLEFNNNIIIYYFKHFIILRAMTDGVNEIIIPAKVVNKLTEPFYDRSAFHHANTYLYIYKCIMHVLILTFLEGKNVYIFYFLFLIIIIVVINAMQHMHNM